MGDSPSAEPYAARPDQDKRKMAGGDTRPVRRAVAALTAVPQDRGETKSYIKPDMIGHHGSLRRAAKGRKRRGHQWTPAAAQHHRLCGRKKSGLFLANPNGAVAAVSATALDGHDRQSAVGDETAET